jgi:hypothetical protein
MLTTLVLPARVVFAIANHVESLVLKLTTCGSSDIRAGCGNGCPPRQLSWLSGHYKAARQETDSTAQPNPIQTVERFKDELSERT